MGRRTETEGFELIIQHFPTELFRHFDGSDIAGIFNDLLDGQPSVGFGIMDPVAAHIVHAVFAVENGAGGDRSGLQGRGGTENFHGGPGLKGIGDGAVSPDAAIEFAEIIGVEQGIVGHGENGAGARLHDDGHAGLGR